LELSISSSSSTVSLQKKGNDKDGEDGVVKLLREHIITVADLREGLVSAPDAEPGKTKKKPELDCVMVDWNILPHISSQAEKEGKGSIDGVSDLVTFTVNGCIDHRPDEGFVPPLERLPPGNPRVIVSGPGSCTSLIVREIRERGLWPSPSSAMNRERRQEQQPVVDDDEEDGGRWEVHLAKLALASILIDTTNLTAEGKVTDVDRDAVSFLTERISSSLLSSSAGDEWDRDSYFEQIQYAKAHSLDWLTVDEILGRDYKDWTESTPSGDKRVVGIASVVRPLSWIIAKTKDEDDGSSNTGDDELKLFLDGLKKFALERHLDVVSVMTAFSTEDGDKGGQFTRELLVWGLKDDYNDILAKFADTAKQQLGLQKWNNFPVEGSYEYTGGLYIWQQGNVSQSRKQVAPVLREVLTS
jgi:exopolyphosphatase